MPGFRVVISDPKTSKAYQVEVEGAKASAFIGKSIGDEIDGSVVGLSGYKLQITGGTDRDGFPMRREIPGPGRRKILVRMKKGVRKRKLARGREISDAISQINTKITSYGKKPVEELLGKKE